MSAGCSFHFHGSIVQTNALPGNRASDIDMIVIWPGLDRTRYRMICRRLASIELPGLALRVEERMGPCLPSRSTSRARDLIALQPQILPGWSCLSPAMRGALEGSTETILGETIPPLESADIRWDAFREALDRDLDIVCRMVCAGESWYWHWSTEGRFRRIYRFVPLGDAESRLKLRRCAASMLVNWAMVLSRRELGGASAALAGALVGLASRVHHVPEFERFRSALAALKEEAGERETHVLAGQRRDPIDGM